MNAPLCACGHFKPLHTDAGCRVNGCRCDGFRDPTSPVPEPEPTATPRRVVLEIPDGYALTVTLTPLVEEQADG